jgi:diaminopropionate ammonia-lyase
VVEGYMTMLTETDKQLTNMNISRATHALASVGVGSWAQAVTMHYKSKSPSANVIAVEPDTAACLKTSLEAGQITSIATGNTIMNGMNCGTVSTTVLLFLTLKSITTYSTSMVTMSRSGHVAQRL